MRALLAVFAVSLWTTAPAPVFGAGIGVTIAERVSLQAEYEVVEIDQLDDSHAVWLTAAWRF